MGRIVRTGRPLERLTHSTLLGQVKVPGWVPPSKAPTDCCISRAIILLPQRITNTPFAPPAVLLWASMACRCCRRPFAGNLCIGGGGQRRCNGLRLAPTDDDDDDSRKYSFGLIHTISAAIGVGALSCLTCITMILRLRLSAARSTTKRSGQSKTKTGHGVWKRSR